MTSTSASQPFQISCTTAEPQSVIDRVFSYLGIKAILFMSFFLIAAVPVILLSAWVERSAVDKEIAAVSEKHLIVAQNLSTALSRYILDVQLFFDLFASEEGPSGAFNIYDEHLENLHLNYIVTLDAADRVLLKVQSASEQSIELPEKELLDHLRAVANAADGTVTVSGIKSFLGSPHFFVLKALPSGKLALAPLDPAYLIKVQKAIVFGERGHSMIVDHQGRVVAHPNSNWQATSKNASKLSVVNMMITGNTGVTQFYSPPMKADMIAGYTYVPETGWGVMVPQPMSELIERAHDVQIIALIIAVILILVAMFLSWWLSNLLAQPILAVVDAARKVSGGKLNAYVEEMPMHAPAEMKVLAATFNTMVDELKCKTNELSSALLKAEEGSQTKSQFMAMMSHEIRTPMNGILGVLELIEDTPLDDEQQKYITVAQNSGNSLIKVINDILDFSNLEAGQLEIVNEPFDVRNTIDDVIHLFRPIADQKSIVIESKIIDDIPKTLVTDPRRTRQVLFSLIGNAVKFTNEGSVKIHSSYETGEADRDTLKFTINDTGIGIPKDMHEKLFEGFSQCDASYSRKYGGTGLGLSISMRLVQLMGGQIGFDSTPDQGSSFWFTLPVETN
jgi:signal transduction histidine kinase